MHDQFLVHGEGRKCGKPSVIFSPLMPADTLARRLRAGKYRYDDDGFLEKSCSRCGEFWPADTEFYQTTSEPGRVGLGTYCKACMVEYKRGVRAQKEELAA